MNIHPTTSYRVKFPAGSPTAADSSADFDGIELTGIVDRPADVSPQHNLPVAVFSHCFTCNKDLKATVRISRALAKSGIAVLRFDMTGLGGSGGDFSQTNFTTNLADLAAAIRYADSQIGPVSTLIGHSFGGIASLVTAAKAQDDSDELPLSQLGFVATLAAPSDTGHLATLLTQMNPAIESAGIATVTIGGIDWQIRKQMLDDFRRHDVAKWLPKIKCPVLLMHSPVDETVGFDHAIRLMSLIQTQRDDATAPNTPVSLLTLAGADHLLIRDPRDLIFVSEQLASWIHRRF
ncbi:alpha/beta fold hydrolase [Stieleria sp. TO1_6]|uniref:alpha/beta hydrolase family protein n=1 Tax=Stieleria tagensis TaxID=2956795 RepID=UPI00209AD906|nr:alpha/beta fold hydrolase [Stieleria tagensis]MCO8120452.1 alpha/beta fold hydrolase [Stieleria tagensis]